MNSQSALKGIFISVLLPTLISALLFAFFSEFFWIHPKKWTILTFFFLLASVNRYTLIKVGQDSALFITLFLGTLVFRLLGSLTFLLIFLAKGVKEPKIFALNFLIVYFFYLFFEIYDLLNNLRPNSKIESK